MEPCSRRNENEGSFARDWAEGNLASQWAPGYVPSPLIVFCSSLHVRVRCVWCESVVTVSGVCVRVFACVCVCVCTTYTHMYTRILTPTDTSAPTATTSRRRPRRGTGGCHPGRSGEGSLPAPALFILQRLARPQEA